MRLFVAVELEPGIREALGGLIAELKRFPADVKWVEEENLHLTLYFLGEVAPPLLAGIKDELAQAAAGVLPFDLVLEGLGAFPGPRRPRVVWVGAAGGEMLLRLQRQVAARLDAFLKRPPDTLAFRPHITLGRVRSPRNLASLGHALVDRAPLKIGRQAVRDFSLMESRLSRAGPSYTCLHRYPLNAGPTAM